ncbi:MAG TPA: AgmX/PglI C-terminal domain-containing protein [Polyangia bacterium]|jgi:outer membrane biosynthesis protein TonB|nr:AgmX/PglI C-terminal domain-containing protein [Polyangia bacterium]HWE31515.1 AgmX/PglI C-terminal domain-containing protein [Polyangia bacterium]
MRKVLAVAGLLSWIGCAGTPDETKNSHRPDPGLVGQNEQSTSPPVDAVNPDRQDAIEHVFARKAGELQDCWTQEYEKNHNRKLEGDLTVGFDISPAGAPGNVRMLKSTIGNPNIEGCVTKQIATWSFPEGQNTVPYLRTVHLGAEY